MPSTPSIYSPYDMRFNNPAFGQQGGNFMTYGTGIFNTPSTGNSSFGGGSTGGSSLGTAGSYNINPSPQYGNGAYGQVPGPIGLPPSIWDQTKGALPGLNTNQLTSNIMSELQGDINPQAIKNMQDAAASYGIQSGMPGSNATPGSLVFNKNLRNIGLDTMQVQQQGLQNYLNTIGAVGQQQLPPALQAEIASRNALFNAAPNPQAAANELRNLYGNALAATRGPGGGSYNPFSPAAGTGNQPQALGFGFNSFGQQSPVTQPSGGGFGYSPDSLYPGTEVPGLNNLGNILGPVNPYYGQSPSPIDTSSVYGGDASSPDYWNFDQFSQPSVDPTLLDLGSFYQ